MIGSGQSILQELGASGCEVAELEQVIGSKLGGWGGDRHDPRALLFPGDQEAYAVKLIYDARHRLRDALAGPALDDAKLAEIRLQITTDLRTIGAPKVGNWILFAPVPVTGAFRYRDEFQILPVPNEAPRPEYLAADHPFLMQFRYVGSPNAFVDQRRRTFRAIELELLLVGLVSSHIHDYRDQSAQWVLLPELEASPHLGAQREFRSVLCQRCYIYPEMSGILADFTSITDYGPLALIAPFEFQNRLGIRIGQVLDLPANFEQAISDYNCLGADQKLRFNNACHWLQHSARTYRSSQSASYIALALAIESLMPAPEPGKVCECCRHMIGKGPTKQFKEFVSQFAPDAGPFEAETKRLYEIRSKLAHGRALLISDREQLLPPALASFEDWMNEDHLHRIVRAALVNWLNEQAAVSLNQPLSATENKAP